MDVEDEPFDVDDVAIAGGDVTVTYADWDTTQAVPCPRRYVVVLPDPLVRTQSVLGSDAEASSHLSLLALPHPRYGALCQYMVGTSPTGQMLLCELQHRSHPFGETWFLPHDTVEPGDLMPPSLSASQSSSATFLIATPIDVTFLAIACLREGPTQFVEKYATLDDIMERSKSIHGPLPALFKDQQLKQAMVRVSECKSFGPDENYYRFSEEMFSSWIAKKHQHIMSRSSLLADILRVTTTSDSASTYQPSAAETERLLASKAMVLLEEYLPASLHEISRKACGVAHAGFALSSDPSPSSQRSGPSTQKDSHESEPAKKQPRLELKSASVKRLEKAGPPKGTPTLMAMFAKRQQKLAEAGDDRKAT